MSDTLKKVLRLMRPYSLDFGIAIAASLGAVLAGLSIPLGLRALMNSVILSKSAHQLDHVAVVLVGLFIVRGASRFIGAYYLDKGSERVVAHLRADVYRKLLNLPLGDIRRHRTGELISRLTSDISTVRKALTEGITILLYQVLQVAGAIVIMIALDPFAALLVCLSMPIGSVLAKGFSGRLLRAGKALQDCMADTSAIATETLGGIIAVKTSTAERCEEARFSDSIQRGCCAALRLSRASNTFKSASEMAWLSAIIALFWYGGRQVLQSRWVAGDFLAFMFYGERISNGLSELTNLFGITATTVGAADRVFEIMSLKPEGWSAGIPGPRKCRNVAVALDSVTFGYGATAILNDLTIEVYEGEHFAIIGPNGAGKSTLVHLLLGFYLPWSGKIYINGADICELLPQQLRSQIAAVTQGTTLFNMSVLDNIKYGQPSLSTEAALAAGRAARVDEFALSLPDGYDTRVGERGQLLSGGQQQRVGLARAIAKNAPLLLLDEATSAIDSLTDAAICDAVRGRAGIRTTLSITHKVSLLERSSRIALIENGALTAVGSYEEIIPLYDRSEASPPHRRITVFK